MKSEEIKKIANDYKVADLSLTEFGKKEIKIAETEMPGFERGDFVCHEDFGVGQFVGFGGSGDGEDFVRIKYLDVRSSWYHQGSIKR